MRFYLILFFCGLGFLFSCSDPDSIPGDVIPKHQMALLLTDIHIIDGSMYNLPQTPDSLKKHGLGLYLAVFKLRHTDTTQFKESLKFYAEHPNHMLDIYTGVVNRLDSLQQAKTKAAAAKPIAKPTASQKSTTEIADSIKKAQAKVDSLQKQMARRTADSTRAIKFRLRMVQGAKDKAKAARDSIRKAKQKHHKKLIPVLPHAVPDK